SERRSGTHNHRPSSSGTQDAPAWHNNYVLWLWVPAFAGTTPNLLRRTRVSYNHSRRLPDLEAREIIVRLVGIERLAHHRERFVRACGRRKAHLRHQLP